MPACVTDVELTEAIEGLTNPEILDVELSKEWAKELGIDGRAIDQYTQEQAKAITGIYNILSDGVTDSMLEKISPQALAAARQVTRLDPQLAATAFSDTQKTFSGYIDEALNSTRASHYGILKRISTALTTALVRSTAKVEAWALNNYGTDGLNSGSNFIVAALRKVAPTFSGTREMLFRREISPILEEMKPWADQLGLPDVDSFARLVGTYQQMRGMRERNDLVDHNLAESIKNELSKEHVNMKAVVEYTKMLKELREHRKDPTANKDASGKYRWHTGGYTDVEADNWIAKFHQDYSAPKDIMEYFGDRLTQAYVNINNFRVEQGFETPENVERLKGLAYFLPIKTTKENNTGLANDATIYNPGNFHVTRGMSDPNIDDGYTTLLAFLRRTSLETATKDLGAALHAVHKTEQLREVKPGEGSVFEEDYDQIQAKAHAGDILSMQVVEGNYGFALSVALPEGNQLSRKMIWFNPTYKDTGLTELTGPMLSDSFKQVESNAIFRGAATLNSWLGSLNTHWNLAFSPINAIKDAGERFSSMLGQSYRLENGELVDGSKFVGSYAASLPVISKFLLNHMRGKVDLNGSDIGRFYQEYVQLGVRQEFDPTQLKNKKTGSVFTADDPNNIPELRNSGLRPFWEKVINLGKDKLKPISQTVSRWNEYFNNIAPFAQYVTLRRLGVTANSAREGVTEVLNLRESGTLTDALRATYIFAKPTMQGAAAALRSLGLAPNARGEFRPNKAGFAYLLGTVAAAGIIKAAVSGTMGEEDYDNKLTFDDKSRFIPIPLSNGVFKIPIPFGTTPFGFSLYNAVDAMYRNRIPTEEGVGHILLAALKTVQPAELPAFSVKEHPTEWFAHLLSPAFLKPIVTTGTNLNYFGGEVTYASSTGLEPKAMQGRVSTYSGYHTMAKAVHQFTGIDLAPEQIKALMDGYLMGPLRAISAVVNKESLYHANYDKTTQGILGPWMSALGVSIGYKTLAEGHSSMYHQAYDRAKAEIRKLGVNIVNPEEYKGGPEERVAYIKSTLSKAGMSEDKIDRFLSLDAADKEKRKLSAELKKKLYSQEFLDSGDSYGEAERIFDDYHRKCEELYLKGLGMV